MTDYLQELMSAENREVDGILDRAEVRENREIDETIERCENLLCDCSIQDCERLLKA